MAVKGGIANSFQIGYLSAMNPAAQALGRLGGIARALKLSKRRKKEIARNAGKAPKRKRNGKPR